MHTWYIPDGYVPSTPEEGGMVGHEAIAVLNAETVSAHLRVDVFFTDRDPRRGASFEIPAERSARIILGDGYRLEGSLRLAVPSETPYSLRLTSDQPLHIQFSRLDTRAANLSLMTTMVEEQTINRSF